MQGYSPCLSSTFRRGALDRVGGLHPLNAQPECPAPYKLLQAHSLSFHKILRYLFTGFVGGHEVKELTE